MTSREELAERKLALEKAKMNLASLMELRNVELTEYERATLIRLAKNETTLLNPGARKMKATFAELCAVTMRNECKIRRRGLFFLRLRDRQFQIEIEQIEEQLNAIEDSELSDATPRSEASEQTG